MQEKIKIYVPKEVDDILTKDMRRFEIVKASGELNKNQFYNLLVNNYYEQYQDSQNEQFELIKKLVLDKTTCKEYIATDLTGAIIQYLENKNYGLKQNHHSDVTLSFKPSAISEITVDSIQTIYCNTNSLSGYFRNMFASYASLPQDKREKIIFKENIDMIDNVLKHKKQLILTVKHSGNRHIVSPYAISNSKEELYNYVICKENNHYKTFRINRICKLSEHRDLSNIEENDIPVFEKMLASAPQYAYNDKEFGKLIKVQLTEAGITRYRDIYLNRPDYVEKQDNIYTFDCPSQQAFQYFSRFGIDAVVLEPESLAGKIAAFHNKAAHEYKKFKKE